MSEHETGPTETPETRRGAIAPVYTHCPRCGWPDAPAIVAVDPPQAIPDPPASKPVAHGPHCGIPVAVPGSKEGSKEPCLTWYDDPETMIKHFRREHAIFSIEKCQELLAAMQRTGRAADAL